MFYILQLSITIVFFTSSGNCNFWKDVRVWFYNTFSSIPYIMLLMAITFIMERGITAVYMALGLTSWVNLCRLVRGEVIRHKDRDYVCCKCYRRGAFSQAF